MDAGGMDRDQVSVVIPAFNRAHVIGDAIDSVFRQGVDGVQVIVVDDGSTDDTRAAVARYGSRVIYLHQPNQGAAVARNRGLEAAGGRLVAFLDSDDVWLPGKLRLELDLLARFPDADAIISDSEFWHEGSLVTGSRFGMFGVELPAMEHPFVSDLPLAWIEKSLFSTCCLTLRRAVLPRLGHPPFDPALRSHEDWDFEIRMYHTCKVLVHPRVLAQVRRFDDGTRGDRGTDRDHHEIQYRVLGRMKDLPPLSAAVTERTWARRRELAHRLAGDARGLRRLRCATLAATELRDGALASAARVLALGLRPRRTPLG
jgi:glycosyltransferase involved in cell wall biosynthesis